MCPNCGYCPYCGRGAWRPWRPPVCPPIRPLVVERTKIVYREPTLGEFVGALR